MYIFWCNVQWSVACYALDHLPMVLGSPTDRGLHGPERPVQVAAWGGMGREGNEVLLCSSGSGWSWTPGRDYRLYTQELSWTEWGLWRDSSSTLSYTEACSTDPPHLHCQGVSVSPQPQRTSQLTMFWNCKLRWSLGWVSQVFCHTKLWKGNTWCSQVILAYVLPNIFAYLRW